MGPRQWLCLPGKVFAVLVELSEPKQLSALVEHAQSLQTLSCGAGGCQSESAPGITELPKRLRHQHMACQILWPSLVR